MRPWLAITVLAYLLTPEATATAAPMGTVLTYQGQLNRDGVPLNGTASFEFRLWTAASGGGVVATIGPVSLPVTNGLFTAALDFGSATFDGDALWLEVRVSYAGGGWTTLSPRQRLTPTPHAIVASSAESLRMPFSATTNSSSSALGVTQTGAGRAASFHTTDAANDNPTLYAEQSGTGRCGHFRITNADNDVEAVAASTTGGGVAVSGYTIGSDSAGRFQIANAGNDSPAVYAVTNGTGYGVSAESKTRGVWGGHSTSMKSGSLGGPDYGVRSDGDLVVEGGALRVVGAGDVEPAGGGLAVIGQTSGINVAIDGNEIMARNNGEVSTLFVNNDGGDVVFGGAIDIGYEIVSVHVEGEDEVTVLCPTGKKVLGGGCAGGTSGDYIEASYPAGAGGWFCRKRYSLSTLQVHAWAICARVK